MSLSFSTIIGHDRPLNILKRALANKTLAHAYILSGEAGVGKKLTAVALAAAVNCRQPGEDGGCGTCPSCRKVASLGHPDLHILESDGDEIKIDQIRQVQSDLALRPFEGAKKMLIIDGAENMNAASANAFLKTLEEPPGEAVIVLVTALPQSLLPTIRSRCQEIRFLPLSRRALAQVLLKRRGLSEEDAWFLAALAQGSMGRGLEMDIGQEKQFREELRQLWPALPGMSAGSLAAEAEALYKDRDRLDRLIAVGVEQLRDAVVLRETGDDRLLVDADAAEAHRHRAGQLPLQRLLADMDLFTAARRLLDGRVSAQLVAENLLMQLARR